MVQSKISFTTIIISQLFQRLHFDNKRSFVINFVIKLLTLRASISPIVRISPSRTCHMHAKSKTHLSRIFF